MVWCRKFAKYAGQKLEQVQKNKCRQKETIYRVAKLEAKYEQTSRTEHRRLRGPNKVVSNKEYERLKED